MPGRESLATVNMIVMCININGLRKKHKRVLLGKLMFDVWAGICIATETHLRENDLDKLRYDNYHVIAHYCRPTPVGERIGGGGGYHCAQDDLCRGTSPDGFTPTTDRTLLYTIISF